MPDGSWDIYDSGFGKLGEDIDGASLRFGRDGSAHHTVYGRNGRFSWDTDLRGIDGEPHFTDQGYPKGDRLRHPFDR